MEYDAKSSEKIHVKMYAALVHLPTEIVMDGRLPIAKNVPLTNCLKIVQVSLTITSKDSGWKTR